MSLAMRSYTTPSVAPLYPAPPIHYRNASLVTAFVDRPLALELPPGVRAGGGGAVVVFADYPESDAGPYREVVVLTPAVVHDEVGLFCALIYVTSDAAMAAGREIWGFPKKIADIAFSIDADGAVECELTRKGSRLSLRGTAAEILDAKAMGEMAAQPIFNEKIVPSASGDAPDVCLLSAVRMVISPHEAHGGTGRLESCSGSEDPFESLLPATADVGIARVLADAILPFGWTVRA